MTLLFSEVRSLNLKVPHLITTIHLVRAATQDGTASEAQKDRGIAAFDELFAIGDRLARELVRSCKGLNELIDDWHGYGYRPSLEAAAGTPEKLLADIYDLVTFVYQIDIQADRCDYNAEGVR